MAAPMIPVPNHPGIYRRGSRYVIKWRDRGKQHKEAFRTLAEARAAKGRRQAGDTQAASSQRFDDYAEGWLATYRGRTSTGLSDSTKEGYKRAIKRHAIPFFGRIKMKDLRPRDVRAFISDMQDKDVPAPTIRNNVAALRVLLATAYEEGDITANPTQGLRLSLGAATGTAKSMTREELGLVLAALPVGWRSFFMFLGQTGLRISEAIGLQWQDVELGTTRPHVKVRRQNYKGTIKKLKTRASKREVPLTPGMVATLLELRGKHYTGEEGPVWSTRRGTPLEDHNLRSRVLRPVVQDLGLEWVGFHTFRHTCASLLFEGGKDVKQVQTWLGHADPAFTLRTYVHLMDDGVGDADFLDAVVSVPPAGIAAISPAGNACPVHSERPRAGNAQGGTKVAPHHPQKAPNRHPVPTVDFGAFAG